MDGICISYIPYTLANECFQLANAENNGCDIEFVEGDLLYPFIMNNAKFDVIVSNPPYISKDYEINNIVKHEPYIALFADNNGLENYEIIVKNLDKVLNKGGILLLEIGYDQREAILNICNQYLSDCEVECFKDISGNDRIVVVKLI